MHTIRHLTAAIALVHVSCFAAPVEYDTADYHVVVCRPLDSWSGDSSVMSDERSMVEDHRGRLVFYDPTGTGAPRSAGSGVFTSTSQDPVTRGAIARMKEYGFSISFRGSYHWQMGRPTELPPQDYPHLRQAQSAVYEALIQKQGDPEKLPGSMMARRILGNVLGFASIGVGLNKFGAIGGTTVATTFAGDISHLPLGVRQAIVPFDLPELDVTQFSTIEVYPVRVNEGGSPGQVIIAYKGARTDATRQAALVQALVSVVGADTTPEAIDAARAADLEHRRTVWKASLSSAPIGAAPDTPAASAAAASLAEPVPDEVVAK
jgi:hypothetical protein